MENLRQTIISLTRTLLDNRTPTEETTKVFIEHYLKPKIFGCLSGKLPDFFWREEANQIYAKICAWLEVPKNTGFNQLSDADLLQKVNNKVYNFLRDRVTKYFADAEAESYTGAYINFFTDEDGNEKELVSMRHTSIEYVDDETVIDEFELEIFKATLFTHPELMIDQIKRECTEPTIKEWLIKTFPSISAFDFLCDGNIIFLSYLQRRGKDGKLLRKVKRDLKHIEIFDRMHGKEGQELEDEMTKITAEYRRHGIVMDNQQQNRIYKSQYKKRIDKYGYVKPTNEITLRVINNEIKLSFEEFVKQYFLIQKLQSH